MPDAEIHELAIALQPACTAPHLDSAETRTRNGARKVGRAIISLWMVGLSAFAILTSQAAESQSRRTADDFNPADISKLLSAQPKPTDAATDPRSKSPSLTAEQRTEIMRSFREQLHRCWQAPLEATASGAPPTPRVRIRLNLDGSLASEPEVLEPTQSRLFQVIAASAIRAVKRCVPLKISPEFHAMHSEWNHLVVAFDPRELGQESDSRKEAAAAQAAGEQTKRLAAIDEAKPRNVLLRSYRAYIAIKRCHESRAGYESGYISDDELAAARRRISAVEQEMQKREKSLNTNDLWKEAHTDPEFAPASLLDAIGGIHSLQGELAVRRGEFSEEGQSYCRAAFGSLRSTHEAAIPDAAITKKDF